jgi:hypothetical protein
LLLSVAERLRACVRPGDTVARARRPQDRDAVDQLLEQGWLERGAVRPAA